MVLWGEMIKRNNMRIYPRTSSIKVYHAAATRQAVLGSLIAWSAATLLVLLVTPELQVILPWVFRGLLSGEALLLFLAVLTERRYRNAKADAEIMRLHINS